MTDLIDSTVTGSTGAEAIPRLEGEIVPGHGGSAAEASPEALTNAGQPALRSPSAKAPGTAPVLPEMVEITRAARRFHVDFEEHKGEDGKWVRNPLRQKLKDAQYTCAMVANALIRRYWYEDAQALDRARAAGVEKLNAETWPPPELNGYQIIRALAPTLNAGIASTISQAVRSKWRSERWEILVKLDKSPPFYRRAGTFPLRAEEVRFFRRDGAPWIEFLLQAGKDRRIALKLSPRDDYQQQILDNLIVGCTAKTAWSKAHLNEKTDDKALAKKRREERAQEVRALPGWRHGVVRVEQDKRKPWKWYLTIPYKRLIAQTTGLRRAGINRGIFCFLVAVADDGERWMYVGDDIVAYLKQVQRRRKEYQYGWKASGRGRHGHGRKRAIKPIEHLSGKAERWRETKCAQIAAGLARWCAGKGIGVVYMEDLIGIRDGENEIIKQGAYGIWIIVQEWPFYMLGQKITSALEAQGIRVEGKIDSDGISQTCPKCGSRNKKYRNLSRWKLECAACGNSEHLDVAAAKNVLARGVAREGGGKSPGLNEKK